MQISFVPKTLLGKWATASMALFVAFVALAQFLARSQSMEIGQENSNPAVAGVLTILGVGAFVLGIASFILGILSFTKKDFSIVVLFATVLGLFPILFLVGEALLPH